MNKYKNGSVMIVGLVLSAVVLVGGFVFWQSQSDKKDSMVKTEVADSTETEAMEKKDPSASSGQDGDDKMMKADSSRYVQYSKAIFDQSKDLRRVLYFYATWCPSCKAANEDFSTNTNKIPKDVVVIRINYNDPDTDAEEKDLAKKYGITYQHTFIQIDANGKRLMKWNGGQTDELIANIK